MPEIHNLDYVLTAYGITIVVILAYWVRLTLRAKSTAKQLRELKSNQP